MMPNMDGWELCRELRASYAVPVLMLTAKGETAKNKGLSAGRG
jgi:DNA-binding response OmpR family regulator